MEFVTSKQCRKRRKKKRYLKRLRERIRLEVRSTKRVAEHLDAFNAREIRRRSTMQADAFWKNYAVAQEWQKRHNVTWWRSRCIALEYENEVLRNKLKSLTREENDDEDAQEETRTNSSNENFELNVTEDMLNFFETSERHRREMQQQHISKIACKEDISEEVSISNNVDDVCVKKE